VTHTNSNDSARPQGQFAPGDHSAGCGPHNPKWLLQDLLPLGGVEVGWGGDDDFNYELVRLGVRVAFPVDGHYQLWWGRRVMQHGAAALIYGNESVEEGVSGRLIVLDPKRPKHIVADTNHKLFEYDIYGRYRLSEAGAELERTLLSIKDLRLIVFNKLGPLLPHGGGPGSLPAWTWLRKLADQTSAAVLVILDGPEQMEQMWRQGIRLAAERRLPQEGAR
jgi:hypothetical protein